LIRMTAVAGTLVCVYPGCTRQTHSLGYNTPLSTQDSSSDSTNTEGTETTDDVSVPTDTVVPDDDGGADADVPSEASTEPFVDSGAPDADADVGVAPSLPVLHDPPNQFVEVLGLEPDQVNTRIAEM